MIQTLLQTANTVLLRSVQSIPIAMAFCYGGPHVVVAGILQFFSNHLAEISVPWQLVPKEMRHCPAHWVTVSCICSSLLGHYAAKFHGKLIVYGSAVFDDIRNHFASVVFESVNNFFSVFVVFFLLANDHFFYICWVLGSESHLAMFYWSLRVSEP